MTTNGRLEGKVALITGGARGQGAAEAIRFAEEGARVVITDVLDGEGKTTAAAIGAACTYHHHDVTSEAAWTSVVDATVAEHGRIDVLVNNAGIFRPTPLLRSSYDEYLRIIDVNQHGVFLGMKAVAPTMVEQRAGSIINISSVAGLSGSPGFIAYGASKWAVRGMTRSAAKELAGYGIRVNSVHPGMIDTAMLDVLDEVGSRAAVMKRVPNGREAAVAEVASLVLFLASDESIHSTGSEFIIDGGMTA